MGERFSAFSFVDRITHCAPGRIEGRYTARDAGKLVPIAETYDNEYDHHWARPDEAAFADAVIRLIEHPGERKALGLAAAARIQSRYKWDETAAGFARLIDEALEPVPDEEHASVR